MAIELSYTQLLDEVKPSLEVLADLTYGDETPISHLLNIAENLQEIDDKSRIFWSTREKLLDPFIEKDKEGKKKTELKKDPETGQDMPEFILTDKNRLIWREKFEELRQTKISVNLKMLEKKHFEGAKGLKPKDLKGCWVLLK